jgi:hypothetical protein
MKEVSHKDYNYLKPSKMSFKLETLKDSLWYFNFLLDPMMLKSYLPPALKQNMEVPPRFELGLLDSESNVLTTRPWNHMKFKL